MKYVLHVTEIGSQSSNRSDTRMIFSDGLLLMTINTKNNTYLCHIDHLVLLGKDTKINLMVKE